VATHFIFLLDTCIRVGRVTPPPLVEIEGEPLSQEKLNDYDHLRLKTNC